MAIVCQSLQANAPFLFLAFSFLSQLSLGIHLGGVHMNFKIDMPKIKLVIFSYIPCPHIHTPPPQQTTLYSSLLLTSINGVTT